MENKEILDELAVECGEVVEEPVAVIDAKDAEKELKKIANRKRFAYDDGAYALPGSDETFKELDEELGKEVSKDEAIENMLMKTAVMKVQNKDAEVERLVKKEQAAQEKKEIIAYLMQQQESAYFEQNGFIMSGDIRRRTRKMLEKQYDKGKFRPNKTTLNG